MIYRIIFVIFGRLIFSDMELTYYMFLISAPQVAGATAGWLPILLVIACLAAAFLLLRRQQKRIKARRDGRRKPPGRGTR